MSDNSEQYNELSKLRWHCRRGVKELDVVFCEFLDNYYPTSEPDIQRAFKELLELEDPVLLSMVMENQSADTNDKNTVLEKLRNLF